MDFLSRLVVTQRSHHPQKVVGPPTPASSSGRTTAPQRSRKVFVPRGLLLPGRVALAIACGVLIPSCATRSADPDPGAGIRPDPLAESQRNRALDSLLLAVRREHGSPAVAAGVVRRGTVVAVGAIGVRSLASGEGVRITDAFHLGSVAKSLSATLIAVLVERGALSWSTTPGDALPEMENAIHPLSRAMTLAQMLAHTAGLPNYNPGTPEWEALPEFEGSAREQRAAFARRVLSQPPVRPPGSGFLYSNAGAALAAAMAERVTGRSWEELMREMIFAPLGLETAGFGWPAADDRDQPWGHWEEGGRLQPHDPRSDYRIPLWMRPAGDVHMSVADLARFAAVHVGGLAGSAGLLRPGTVREMHAPVTSRTETIDHALGWHVWTERAGPRAGRSFSAGGGGTFVAFVEISPALEVGIVIMTSDGREPSRVVAALRSGLEELFITGDGAIGRGG
jgi:D-alanyl-D-alanine carboxypeptidase